MDEPTQQGESTAPDPAEPAIIAQERKRNAPKRNAVQLLQIRAEVARRYLTGKTQRDIAHELNITRDMVRYDLDKLAEEWRKDAIFDYNAKKDLELARINHLESTYWDAWEESKKNLSKTRNNFAMRKKRGKGALHKKLISQIREDIETRGELAALEGVRWCIDRRIKLLGLDPQPIPKIGDIPITANVSEAGGVVYLPAFAPPRIAPVITDGRN